jgi:hypothetical protein
MKRSGAGETVLETGRSGGFHAQSGTRKLVIKNLRVVPRSAHDNHFMLLWSHVEKALKEIYDGTQPLQPLELLYRDVEDICRNGQAEKLYERLDLTCTRYLRDNLLPNIAAQTLPGASKIETLRAVHNAWQQWNSRAVCSSRVKLRLRLNLADANTFNFQLP